MTTTRSFPLGERTITLETGGIARQAHGSVIVRSGTAVVLATVVLGEDRPTEGGFLPLTVDYREKLAAVGRIPGSGQRREGRILDHEVLASRLVDRTLRPLVAAGIGAEVQVQATVLSASPEDDDLAILALIGAAAAAHVSPLPFEGPAAAARIVLAGGRSVVMPSRKVALGADAELFVAATRDGLVMVEGGGNEIPEARVVALLAEAREALVPCFEAMDLLKAAVGVPKRSPVPAEGALRERLAGSLQSALLAALGETDKVRRRAAVAEVVRHAVASNAEAEASAVRAAVADVEATLVRRQVVEHGRRLDGRGPTDIRPISAAVRWLPVPHGSAMFTRGGTQALVTATLGGQNQELLSETLRGTERSRFFLHYNFPPYSVGEVRAQRGPGRREIGHGALAERALEAVMPAFGDFPYVVRVESDITESNGSSSMATVCGGTLALMDAGVPIKAPVAGIAMGLVQEGDRVQILSDILGDEDFLGDMDFKVAGTRAGITAVQLDNKLGALSLELLARALDQARAGRLHILDAMATVLPAPRAELAPGVPRSVSLRIPSDAVGLLIGPKGSTIKGIQSSLGVELSVTDEGLVTITAADAGAAARARLRVREIAGVVEVNKLYRGRIVAVKDFGAVVRIFDTAEGLVHVSEWDQGRTEAMEKVAREGDGVVVRVLGVDQRGRLRLSRRAALDAGTEPVENA